MPCVLLGGGKQRHDIIIIIIIINIIIIITSVANTMVACDDPRDFDHHLRSQHVELSFGLSRAVAVTPEGLEDLGALRIPCCVASSVASAQ